MWPSLPATAGLLCPSAVEGVPPGVVSGGGGPGGGGWRGGGRKGRPAGGGAGRFPAPNTRMPIHLENETTLVAEARAGNPAAFTTLVNQYDRNIYRLARNITRNREG